MGLNVQLGHLNMHCINPAEGHTEFIVIHTNGLHRVKVLFCNCLDRIPLRQQLLRQNWYPATVHYPQTCCTVAAIRQYHIMTLTGKMTGHEYYLSLERLTDNTGLDVPNVSFINYFSINYMFLSPRSHVSRPSCGLFAKCVTGR